MTEDHINYHYITQYIRETIPQNEGILKEMERYAYAHHVPIVHPEVARLIFVIARIVKPTDILEIGTAIGYSALLLAKTLKQGGKIDTIERYGKMIDIAKENIRKANLEDSINIIEGDATEILPALEGEYDYIFVDAAKGKYMTFLPHCIRLLREGGVLVSDNVLYKGMIATDALVVRRKKTIVKRMRDYLAVISDHRQLETTVIPIGDGVAISYKLGS
ncbi:MAG: O-methyltransferase [Firmicutes bacterium]|nr:O-methyltransferase [Bacillota bacterium]